MICRVIITGSKFYLLIIVKYKVGLQLVKKFDILFVLTKIGCSSTFYKRAVFLMLGMIGGLMMGTKNRISLVVVMYFAVKQIPELSLLRDYRMMSIIGGSIILSGIVVSVICTLFAVNKYLRLRTDDLY